MARTLGVQPGTAGRPLPNVSLRIVDPETFAPSQRAKPGFLLVNGPSRMIGYLGDPERTAQSLVDDYYSTGDLAYVDADGFLKLSIAWRASAKSRAKWCRT